jgi:hypothetical protein
MTPRERRSQTGSFARSFGAIRYGADYGRWYPMTGLTWIKKASGRTR